MHITIRPIEPSDKLRIVQSAHLFSDQTKYQRFHSPTPSIPKRMLKRFTEINLENEHAFVALNHNQLVGVARWIRLDDPQIAEFAIIVADKWQNKSLGKFMLHLLKDDALQNGITRFSAFVQRENLGAYRLFTKVYGQPTRRINQGSSEDLLFQIAESET